MENENEKPDINNTGAEVEATATVTETVTESEGAKEGPKEVNTRLEYQKGYAAGSRGFECKHDNEQYLKGYARGKAKFDGAKPKTEPAPEAVKEEKKPTSENPELDAWETEPGREGEKTEEQPGAPEYTPPPIDISEYVTGAMFLMMCEYVFPIFLKYVVGFFEPKFKRLNEKGKTILRATEKELAELEKAADQIAKAIFAELPAWAGFGLLYGFIKIDRITSLDDTCFDPDPAK